MADKKKRTKPRAKTLANFKGTRKQLAKRYGVSERTIYRWINEAKEKGTEIQSREKRSKYPGASILDEQGTNKEIADRYGVSTRTITRWRSRAIMESEPWEVPEYKAEEQNAKQWGEPTEDPWEVPEPEIEEPWEVPEPEESTEDAFNFEDLGMKEETFINLKELNNMIAAEDFVNKNSKFRDFSIREQIVYLNKYIQYQYELDPEQFYDPVEHRERFDAPWVSNLNIWGDEFEYWLEEQLDSDLYEI